jgi:hypothetical protein
MFRVLLNDADGSICWEGSASWRNPLRVNRVCLTPRPLLPVYPNQRTSEYRPGWSFRANSGNEAAYSIT